MSNLKTPKKMKTLTLNAYVVISMIVALIGFWSGNLPVDTNPKLIAWMLGTSAALSLVLKTFFSSGQWAAKGWSTAFWIVNGGTFVMTVFSTWGNMGLIPMSIVTGVVGTLNILVMALGTQK